MNRKQFLVFLWGSCLIAAISSDKYKARSGPLCQSGREQDNGKNKECLNWVEVLHCIYKKPGVLLHTGVTEGAAMLYIFQSTEESVLNVLIIK